jgi:2-polyprenyl-3-methyl-5-hydroxy-6-metoxy-1,4-benzoquinol methylase
MPASIDTDRKAAAVAQDVLEAALRKHVGAWYANAYGDAAPHAKMIETYATGAAFKIKALLGPRLEAFMANPPRRVLDVGCGFAHIPVTLANLWPRTEVVATDLRDSYYRHGRAAAEELGLRNVRFESVAAEEVDMPGAFDLVLSTNMLNFMPTHERLARTLAAMARATAPGGFVGTYTPHFGSIREAFTGVPFLHWLPRPLQSRISKRLGKRSNLEDVRSPALGEMREIMAAEGMRFVGVDPPGAYRRLRRTHIAVWYER